MLDLTNRRTTATVVLAAMTVKRAGRNDNSLSVRLDLAIPIGDESGATTFDAVVPGSLALWRRHSGGSEDRARLNRSPSELMVVAALRDPTAESGVDREPILSVMAMVERLSFVSSPKFVNAIFRLRLVIDPSLLGLLGTYLDRQVEVSLSTPQQVLPFARSESEVEQSRPVATERPKSHREIVSFEVEARSTSEKVVYGFGLVVEETPDEILVSDFGVSAAIQAEHVIARVDLLADDSVISAYEQSCRESARTPTWADLITALGVEWARSAAANEPLVLREHHVRSLLDPEGGVGGA